MNILKLLASESFLTVNKPLARLVGLEAAALFADLASAQVYWDNEKGTQGEYFYRTRDMIEAHTTLSAKLQLKAEKELKRLGLIQVQLKGLPATNHYSIGQQEQLNLLNKISPMGATRQAQTDELDATNGLTIKNRVIKNKEIRIDNNKEERKKVFPPSLEDKVLDIDIKKPATKRKKKPTINLIWPASFTPNVINLLTEYMEMRKQIGKAMTSQLAFTKMVNACEKIAIDYGGEAVLIHSINSAIAAQWLSIYPKPLNKPTNQTNNGNQSNNLHPETAKTIDYLKHCIDTFDLDTL
jgi:hypothetical protein